MMQVLHFFLRFSAQTFFFEYLNVIIKKKEFIELYFIWESYYYKFYTKFALFKGFLNFVCLK